MKKRKLKSFVVPVFSAVLFSILVITIMSLGNSTSDIEVMDDTLVYVNSSIINNSVPTLSEDDIFNRPYSKDNVSIYKKFYDLENSNEDSIIYYNNTYMQNSGVIYKSDEEFDVQTVLDGEVIDVKKDEVLGYVVEIKHSNNLISTYSGLKSADLKKGDNVSKGTVIGKSGKLTLDKELENSLLFELIKDGKYVNPEKYYDKKVKEI